MARISDEDIERVRAATDLVQLIAECVELKPRGRNLWGCCPFHHEKTPSFKVDPDLQLWHCFGCGKSGNVFGFVMESENMEFPDAVRYLAERAHIEIVEQGSNRLPHGHRERLKALVQESESFYSYALMRNRSEKAAEARAYLAKRGFGSDVCKRWGLGFAPGRGSLVRHLTKKGFSRNELIDSNMALERQQGTQAGQVSDRFYDRIMFPIHDAQGAAIAFGGRVIGKTPPNTGKYINTSDTPIFSKRRNMYAFDKAKSTITASGTAVVVEGYTDVIALHEAGITNVVATLGTALTPEHLRMLRTARPKRIVYLFDGDEAGQNAADHAAELLDLTATMESGRDFVELLVSIIPGGQDPAEFVADKGVGAMRDVIDAAQPLMRFAIDRRLAKWDLISPEQRTRALADVAKILAPIKGTLASDDYANYVADKLNARFETVQRAFMGATPETRVQEPQRSGSERGRGDSHTSIQSDLPLGKLTESEQLECELISVAVTNPRILPRLSDAFSRTPWTSSAVAMLATLALDHTADESPAAIVASLENEVAGAGAYLAQAQADIKALGGLDSAVKHFLNRLIEIDLEERIRLGNESLKQAANQGEVVDNSLFAYVAKLQQELTKLRSASS